MPTQRVLLIGACSLIGAHILHQLLLYDASVRAVVFNDHEAEELSRRYPETTTIGLDIFVLKGVVSRDTYHAALTNTDSPFCTIIHTSYPEQMDQTVCNWTDLFKLAAGVKQSILESVQHYAPNVERIIIVNSATAIADLAKRYGIENQEDSKLTKRAKVSSDEDSVTAICKLCVRSVEDALWEFVSSSRPCFDVFMLSSPVVLGPGISPPRTPRALEEGNRLIWERLMVNNGSGVSPLDNTIQYADARDLAFAAAQAAFVSDTRLKSFSVCAGELEFQTIANYLAKLSPPLQDRVGSNGEAMNSSEPVSPQKARSIDSTPTAAVLGLIKYFSADETLRETASQLLAVDNTRTP